MISQIQIKNFKSIVGLTLDLGRVNLFIGENGSGKSNILESVAFASAVTTLGLDNSIDDFTTLSSKGVRIAKPELFCNAFVDEIQDIEINIIIESQSIKMVYKYFDVDFDTVEDEGWKEITWIEHSFGISKLLEKYGEYIEFDIFKNGSKGPNLFNRIKIKNNPSQEIKDDLSAHLTKLENYEKYRQSSFLTKYAIYSPENSSLRKFEEESQLRPLGIRGEGLFSLLKTLVNDNGNLQHIKEHLELIDWFEDFSIPNDLMSNEFRISIKDRFINSDLKYFDQRSANEGFLFLLFYVVLFSSKRTPQFFAIDNIEASFNPKLCAKLINMLVGLSKQNEKQVLMTTHNPATLDGLDLNDDEQRLFVVKRNIDGHTIATRITEKPKLSMPMKLSEMWTKGLLGGLPDNF